MAAEHHVLCLTADDQPKSTPCVGFLVASVMSGLALGWALVSVATTVTTFYITTSTRVPAATMSTGPRLGLPLAQHADSRAAAPGNSVHQWGMMPKIIPSTPHQAHESQSPVSLQVVVGLLLVTAMSAMASWVVWRRASAGPVAWATLNTVGEGGHPLDPLVTKLRRAPYAELRQLIAENLPRLGPPFYLRIAELSDQATTLEEKARLASFSQLMVQTMEQMYSTAEKKLSEEKSTVLTLLQLCAEDNGEFVLPLADAKLQLVRTTIRGDLMRYANDNFVTTIRAYMKKAAEDQLDGVVAILQKILQVFGAEVLKGFCCNLKGDRCTPQALSFLNQLLEEGEETWEAKLSDAFFGPNATLDTDQFSDMLNEDVGGILFQLPTGSPLQQVCAEYVQEILDRLRQLKDRQTDSPSSE